MALSPLRRLGQVWVGRTALLVRVQCSSKDLYKNVEESSTRPVSLLLSRKGSQGVHIYLRPKTIKFVIHNVFLSPIASPFAIMQPTFYHLPTNFCAFCSKLFL